MQDEALAMQIVEAVVAACALHGVPVTLKNAHRLGRAGEKRARHRAGRRGRRVQMLTIHGRTREQGRTGA